MVWKPKESFTAFLLPSSVASHWLFTPFIVLAGRTLLPLLLLLLPYHALFFLSHSPFFFLIWQLHFFFLISSQKRNTVQQTEMKRWNKFIGRFSCPCRQEYLANIVADTDLLWLQMTIPINMTWQCQTTCCLKAELLHNRNGMKAQPEGSQTSVTFVESFMFLQSVTAQKKNMIV